MEEKGFHGGGAGGRTTTSDPVPRGHGSQAQKSYLGTRQVSKGPRVSNMSAKVRGQDSL